MSINTITRTSHPDIFDSIIDDYYDIADQTHRRGSSFFRRDIYLINEKYFPEHPELWGFWESDDFLWDDDWGRDEKLNAIYRVEKREKIITTHEWIKVTDTDS